MLPEAEPVIEEFDGESDNDASVTFGIAGAVQILDTDLESCAEAGMEGLGVGGDSDSNSNSNSSNSNNNNNNNNNNLTQTKSFMNRSINGMKEDLTGMKIRVIAQPFESMYPGVWKLLSFTSPSDPSLDPLNRQLSLRTMPLAKRINNNGRPLWKKQETMIQERIVKYITVDPDGFVQEVSERSERAFMKTRATNPAK